jgi:sortase B
MNKKHSKDNSSLHTFLSVIRIICIVVIIICLIYIVKWYIENKKNADMLKNIKDESILETKTISVQLVNNDDSNPDEDQPNTIEIPVYELDFNKLFSINKSTVGWITVPNTSIDYPVAQGQNNEFYLNHSFDNSSNTAGWIFADYRNKFDGTDKNIIIYGHNRMDTSMFATLKNTQKSSWYNNNKYITYTTPSGTLVYEVFSLYTVPMESYYLTTDFFTDASYLEFLNTIKSRSIHNFNVDLNSEDKILTLSTCDSTGKSRVVLHAKQIN